MVHPSYYREAEAAAVAVEAVVVAVAAEAVVVAAVAVVMMMMTAEMEEGEVAQAGVTVQSFSATPFPPVLTTSFRWNLWKMNSQRPRSPQNRAPQPVPGIPTGIATLIRRGSSGFLFCSKQVPFHVGLVLTCQSRTKGT